MNCEELAAAEECGPAPSCSAPLLLAGPPEGQVSPQIALVVPLPLLSPSGSFLSLCSDGRGEFQVLISSLMLVPLSSAAPVCHVTSTCLP